METTIELWLTTPCRVNSDPSMRRKKLPIAPADDIHMATPRAFCWAFCRSGFPRSAHHSATTPSLPLVRNHYQATNWINLCGTVQMSVKSVKSKRHCLNSQTMKFVHGEINQQRCMPYILKQSTSSYAVFVYFVFVFLIFVRLTLIISNILEQSSFQKYTTCWVFFARCHMLYLCILDGDCLGAWGVGGPSPRLS